MKKKLYNRAYRFLGLRSTGQDPFKAIDDLKPEERDQVITFLKRQHQVKFL